MNNTATYILTVIDLLQKQSRTVFVKGIIAATLLVLIPDIPVRAQVIKTIAGNGLNGYTGDNGPATSAEIDAYDIAIDGSGNLYFPQYNDNVIRKVNTAHIITTIGGTGAPGYSGDGGPATNATFNFPWSLKTDHAGNLYVADVKNYCIRKINTSGYVSTVAGNGHQGNTGDGGPATNAELYSPNDVAIDGAGNIYIADIGNDCVRKVDASGMITTFAGQNNIAGTTGDGGPATAAKMEVVKCIAVDNASNVYISDDGRIRKVDPTGTITTIAGQAGVLGYGGDGGPATAALLNPEHIAADGAGNLYIAESNNYRIRKINPSGIITTIAGNGVSTGYNTGDGGPATAAQISSGDGVAIDATGTIYIATQLDIREIYRNSVPYFAGGASQKLAVCENAGMTPINNLLAVIDSDVAQTETWSYITHPAHGTLLGGVTTPTTGDTVKPTGLWYSPTPGYTGNDTFSVRVTDAMSADTIMIYVTVSAIAAVTGAGAVCVGATASLSDAAGGGAWSSSNTGVATITGTGVVTGVSAGTATISYTQLSGCMATHTMTVTTAPTSITGAGAVCVGATTTLSDGIGGGTWTSSNTAKAIVSSGTVVGVAAGTATITYSLGGGCIANQVMIVNPQPAAITGATTVCVGASVTVSDIGGGLWSTDPSGNANMLPTSGTVTGINAGTATISYTLPSTGCAATKTITVNAAPNYITGTTTVCVGIGAPLSDATSGGTWLSNAPAYATMAGNIVNGIKAGTATISYTLATGCNTTTVITVNALPGSITGAGAVCVGATTTLSDVGGGLWSTDAGGNAYMLPTSGAVTGVNAGTATVSYTLLTTGCAATKTITVNAAPNIITGAGAVCVGATITVSDAGGGTWTSGAPAYATMTGNIVNGIKAGTATISYTLATGCNTTTVITIDPLPGAITGAGAVCVGAATKLSDATSSGTWTSGNTTIATVEGTTGTVTGVSATTTVISYTTGAGCTTYTLMTVNPAAAPITGVADMCAGGTTRVAADTSTGGIWTSTLVSVTTGGLMTASTTGAAAVTYTLPTGCAATEAFVVNPLPDAIAGATAVCTGTGIGVSDTTTGGTWTSANTTVGVDHLLGAVVGITAGTAAITYTLPTGCLVTDTITVNASPTVITGGRAVCAGATSGLNDTLAGGTWNASSGGIATIDPGTGVVTGIAAGLATVTYTVKGGCTAATTVTVQSLPTVYSVTGGGSLCAGSAGAHIFLSSSASGVRYYLYNGGTIADSIDGTTAKLDYGAWTTAGSYTIIATDTTTECSNTMSGSPAIIVNPVLVPGATIVATPGGTVCSGTAVNFAATPVNGGTAPTYKWTVNGVVTGVTGTSYTYVPVNADVVVAEMTSNATCADPVTGDGYVVMTVAAPLTPTVTVSADPGTAIVKGTSVTFTANVTGGSTTLAYQWTVNTVAMAGATNATYTTSDLSNGDAVNCTVGMGDVCNTIASGNGLPMMVNSTDIPVNKLPAMEISILPNPNNGVFTITGIVGNADETVTITITDMPGQVVYQRTITATGGALNETVYLNNTIASGMYLLTVRAAGGAQVFRVVVE